MAKELGIFENITHLDSTNSSIHLNHIVRSAYNFAIELHKLGFIDDIMLNHTIGVKKHTSTGYQKNPGNLAKHFVCDTPGYAYPLLKTHKLTPDTLQEISIFNIPTRLLQSAGNITTRM